MIPHVTRLYCGYEIEKQLIEKVVLGKNPLPQLEMINDIHISVYNMEQRQLEQECLAIIKKLPMFSSNYRLASQT